MSDFEKALVEFFKENNQFTVLTVVYKVVWKSYITGEKKYNSCSEELKRLDLMLEYVIGEKTIPEVGKIFIFKDLYHALLFKSHGRVILCGYASNVSKMKKNYSVSLRSIRSIIAVKNYWENSTKNKTKNFWMIISGTYLCDSFTPTNVINRNRR